MSSQVEIHMKTLKSWLIRTLLLIVYLDKDVEIFIIIDSHGMYHFPGRG